VLLLLLLLLLRHCQCQWQRHPLLLPLLLLPGLE
jgi:hypothetical protein